MALPELPEFRARPPSVSEMVIEYLNYHLKLYEARQAQFKALKSEPSSAFISGSVPQLQEVAAAGVVKSLREDPSEATVKVITDSVPAHVYEVVMKDPRIHYTSFRRLNAKKAEEGTVGEGDEVDEWIQRNERWLRVDGTDWGLVTLEDAKAIFPTATHTQTEITIPRRLPPSTSFCFLDQKRPSTLSLLPSTADFITTFNRVTNNCLRGLDWTNVLLAGGMPLNILLCTSPALDDTFLESDLDLYIHGLTPPQANAKIHHIYEVWRTNLGPTALAEGLCIKNSKTINFLATFPHRRLQIVLKIVKNPAEVLLNFDLDPCAIGFDGSRVLMLPRAARALETGYTTFTMHLVHGHHLGDRRETQEIRVYKYAFRGFGIRILPCYMDGLTLDIQQRRPHEGALARHQYGYSRDGSKVLSGLKAVKRIAFVAEDMVRRFVLNEGNQEDARLDEEFDNRRWSEGVPVCSFKVLDSLKQHIGQPGGRVGIKSFEQFFRHCAAWKFECEGRLRINYKDFADTYQTEGTYDDLPSFSWDEYFTAERFMRDIDTYNLCLHRNMLGLFDHIEDGEDRWEKCQLKRMAVKPARMVHAKTLQGVMDQQIAIPIFIPSDLGERFETTYNRVMKAAGLTDPLLYSHTDPEGNLMVQLWLIGNETMWARIDRTIDEIFESLWTFFHIQQLTPGRVCAIYANEEDDYYDESTMQYLIREHFERRIPRPIPAIAATQVRESTGGFFEWPSEEEKALFGLWMSEYPQEVYRGIEAPYSSTSAFGEHDYLGEPEEEKYWGSDDEREEGRVWRDLVEEVKRKRKRIDSRLIEGEKFPRI